MSIEEVYRLLIEAYGPQGWWPLVRRRGGEPEYFTPVTSENRRFEVAAGSVLTQNTAWRNASRAVSALSGAGLLDPERIARADAGKVARLVRPAGYYNQKAGRLIGLGRFFAGGLFRGRDSLLSLEGIGPETADSIMLYAYGEPFFVVDAYTRRIFGRLSLLEEKMAYESVRELFERALGPDPALYGEYHALIVEHGKRFCGRSPVCDGCPLERICPAAGKGQQDGLRRRRGERNPAY